MTRSATRACFIVNPRSAAGATGKRVPDLERAASAAFREFEIRRTAAPGHAAELAGAAAREGFDLVVAVGGDGTAHEVVNGLLDFGRAERSTAAFTAIPAGTGSDLVKTLGMPKDVDAAVQVAAHGETRRTDVLDVEVTHDGAPRRLVSINVVGFGANGEVVRRANRSSKRLGGKLTFLGATLATIALWRPRAASLTWTGPDGSEGSWQGVLSGAFLANGLYCGGGMYVGRGGAMDDGVIELVILPELPLLRQLATVPRLFSGRLDAVDGVVRTRATRVTARSLAPDTLPPDQRDILVDTDGEAPGILPIDVRIRPSALDVRGKWSI